MKVLVATTVLPVASAGGGEVVTHALIEALGDHDVEVIGYLRPEDAPPRDASWHVADRRPIETAAASTRTRAAWALRALLTRRGFSEAKYVSRAYRRAVERSDADLVIVDHAQMAWVADHVAAPVVLLAHNVERDLYAEAGGLIASREARRLGAAERALAARATAVWALTESDARAFRALGANARAFAVPPAAPPADPPPRTPGTVRLLGTWTWGPNRAGLRWFADEVLPHLPADVEVVVAGRGGDDVVAGTRITPAGFVEDATAFLASAGAIAVPSVAGAGVQIKTLDAIASGAPVVATPIAMRGIDDAPPGVRVEREPRAFAAALAEAARTEADAAAGRAWAERRAARFAEDVSRAAADAAR